MELSLKEEARLLSLREEAWSWLSGWSHGAVPQGGGMELALREETLRWLSGRRLPYHFHLYLSKSCDQSIQYSVP